MHVSEFEENFLLFSIAYRTCKFLLLFEWHCRKVKKGTVSCLLRYVTFYLMNQEETVLIKVEMELYFVLLKKKKKEDSYNFNLSLKRKTSFSFIFIVHLLDLLELQWLGIVTLLRSHSIKQ